MDKILLKLVFILFPVLLQGQLPDKKTESFNLVTDKMFSHSPSSIKIGGYLGEKIDLVIGKRIKNRDVDHLIEPFRHKNETRMWQSEFWGKWILSAIAAYEYNRDPVLLDIIKDAVRGLLDTQTPDGYIGNYSDAAQLQQWDIWGRKYTLLGLLAYFDISGDREVLRASRRLADHLLARVGPGKTDIVRTGNYRGMPSSSVLEPMVYLYRRTGDKKYLDFANYIVDQWETSSGPKLISSALAGVPVSERFPHPASWWSYENGQKAYEMMSCYEGLLELYRITGEPSYLKAVELAVRNIISDEINIAGSGSAFECWYKGIMYQTEPTYHTMETCVTMTWMKLCLNLLRLKGDSMYADQIEKSTFNALLASVKYDGTQIAKYSPLGGIRHAGEEQCGMHINCCNANGPRAFMMLPCFAIMGNNDGIIINLFGNIEAVLPFSSGNRIRIEQVSDYPVTDKVEIKIDPERSDSFSVAVRIPSWSPGTTVTVNGSVITDVISGTYRTINRIWNKGDRITVRLDLRGRVVKQNGNQAILRGPVVLARDTRFNDGSVYEPAVISERDGAVDLIPSTGKPANIWMSFTAPLVLGTDLEGEFRKPKQINFCDFASAGNTWGEDSRYQVWIPQTLNVMKTEYRSY